MRLDRGDGGSTTPTGAPVGGVECQRGGLVDIVDGHNDGAAGLNERLTPDTRSIVGSALLTSPRISAIGGGTHVDDITTTVVIPLHIAMTVKNTRRGSITDNP